MSDSNRIEVTPRRPEHLSEGSVKEIEAGVKGITKAIETFKKIPPGQAIDALERTF